MVHSVVHWALALSKTTAFSEEVDAVHQRPVEVEQKHGLDAHGPGSSSGPPPFVAIEAERGNAPVRAPIVNRDSVRRRAGGHTSGYFIEAYQYSVKYRVVTSKG